MGERAAYLCELVGEETLADLVRLRAQWSQAEADGEELAARMHRWWARQGDRRRAWVVRDADGVAVAMGNLAIFERMPKPGVPTAAGATSATCTSTPPTAAVASRHC